MLDDYFTWLAELLDIEFTYYAVLSGVFFGIYVFYKGDEESSWRDIVGWGTAVYIAYFSLANLHRWVDGADSFWSHFHSNTIRWWVFIFTIVLTAGIMRQSLKRWKVRRDGLS